MTLADAITTVAMAGCRLVPDDAGSVALVVPEGAIIPSAVLDVLRAHREQLGAAHVPPAPAAAPARAGDDLADYLREKGLAEAAVELVVHAAHVFNVSGQAIVHELADEGLDDGREPAFFEPGIPILTTIDTEWHAPGRGYFTVPAGTLGLAIPQRWAIADNHARDTIERVIDDARRQKKPLHVAVWLAGEPRALDLDAFTFEGATAPPGMDLTPWRSRPGAVAA